MWESLWKKSTTKRELIEKAVQDHKKSAVRLDRAIKETRQEDVLRIVAGLIPKKES